MHIADYMTSDVVTANLDDGLHQTFHRMRERGIRHMPVLGDDGQLAGIISDRDLRRPDFVDTDPNTTAYYRLDNAVKVGTAMTASPDTVKAADSVEIALEIFVMRKHGALPVVDDAGKLVGVVSAHDLLRAFRDHLAQ